MRASIIKPRHVQDDCLFSGALRDPYWRRHVDVHAATADSEMTTMPNPAHALDAAMSFSLHIGYHWRGTSDVRR